METEHATARPPRRLQNQTLGAEGETIAANYLEHRGFRIIARNWHTRYGEIDVVAIDAAGPRPALVGVEVKTRRGSACGGPLAAVTPRKVARLRRLLYEWCRLHGSGGHPLRIDVIGITLLPGEPPHIDHLRGVE